MGVAHSACGGKQGIRKRRCALRCARADWVGCFRLTVGAGRFGAGGFVRIAGFYAGCGVGFGAVFAAIAFERRFFTAGACLARFVASVRSVRLAISASILAVFGRFKGSRFIFAVKAIKKEHPFFVRELMGAFKLMYEFKRAVHGFPLLRYGADCLFISRCWVLSFAKAAKGLGKNAVSCLLNNLDKT